MAVEIKNRWNGQVIATGETNKSTAEANKADLRYADLSGADLSGANLSDANLSDADLSGANLSDANLSDADLSDADLRYANLRYADLRYANLSGANLSDADLSDADLSDAKYLRYVVPVIENIHQTIYAAASQPDALEMSSWHSCSTTHCRAGWVVNKAGESGRVLESCLGPNVAAALIYLASDPTLERVPSFYASNEQALADMKEKADAERERLAATQIVESEPWKSLRSFGFPNPAPTEE